MHTLLLGLARRPAGIQLPGTQIFVQDFEIRIALQHGGIDWWKHFFGLLLCVWRHALTRGFHTRSLGVGVCVCVSVCVLLGVKVRRAR